MPAEIHRLVARSAAGRSVARPPARVSPAETAPPVGSDLEPPATAPPESASLLDCRRLGHRPSVDPW